MTQTRKQQAIFPDLPRDPQVIDENGKMTEIWKWYFQSLTLALQTNFNPEGILVPSQSAANIALLTGIQSSANILYDSTNNEFKGNKNGTWFTFTLT
jgi:hypothetical protein